MTQTATELNRATLVIRLDDLMMRLDQEGRTVDSMLVREALDALPKLTVIDTPWTTPRKGDRCTRVDGKSREATRVRWYGWPGQFYDEPGANRYPDRVWYESGGQAKECSASSWATWCRSACRDGGTYERAEST